MIIIKNLKVFNCSINESFHWSKLPKLKEKMNEKKLVFPNFANLRNADLWNADLRNADLGNADLSYADLRNADLWNADLRKADLWNADLGYADLRNANLRNADLWNADLSYADLRNANLRNADLWNADLSYANLRNADLWNADLSYANLRNADLGNADLRNAKLTPIDNNEVIIEDFMSVCGLGSENRQTLIFKTNLGIVLKCDCFYGTEKQFRKQVKETHGTNNYAKEYLEMLKLAKIRFSREEK